MAKKKRELKESLQMPQGVQVSLVQKTVTLKGPKGELSQDISDPRIEVKLEGTAVRLQSKILSRHLKKKLKSYKAHILNKIKGVLEGYRYRLKICSGHFPMSVSIAGAEFFIKNFLGEKVPRVMKVKPGASVKIEGDLITVESADKERAGQIAADIEQLARIVNRDRRVFQDGIYMIEKANRQIK